VRYVGKQVLGEENVLPMGQEMGGDDFSFLSQHMPGTYFALGVLLEGNPKALHTPDFDVDEKAIVYGTAMLAASALHFLNSGKEFSNKQNNNVNLAVHSK
jgi:metal-dependent amidase/aminoacylase/carboxypeptidase family protein